MFDNYWLLTKRIQTDLYDRWFERDTAANRLPNSRTRCTVEDVHSVPTKHEIEHAEDTE